MRLLLLFSLPPLSAAAFTLTNLTTPPLLTTNLTNPLPSTPFCLIPSPTCHPPLYTDCATLLSYILANPASRKLREFTPSPPPRQSDWQVPSTFYHASCRLTLSPLVALEWSSFAEIATSAVEAATHCLGPAAAAAPSPPGGRYAAGFNVAGLGEGLGVYVHGMVAGAGGLKVGAADKDGQPRSCESVEEGRVVDLEAAAAAGVGGWVDGVGVPPAEQGEEGLLSVTKMRRRRWKG